MSQYRELLKEVRRNRGQIVEEPSRPLKRRKKNRRRQAKEESNSSSVVTNDTTREGGSDAKSINTSDSDVTEVKPAVFLNSEDKLDLKYDPVAPTPAQSGDTEEINLVSDEDKADSDSGDEFDSDEFENVELESDSMQLELEPKQLENITVSIKAPAPEKKEKRNVNIIDREEKAFRKSFHMSTIAAMACHGLIRNHWINDESLLEYLRKSVPKEIKKSLRACFAKDPQLEMSYTEKQIHSRKLLDCLKRLMEFWNLDFTVNSDVGIYKKLWQEIEGNKKSGKSTTRLRFKNRVMKKRGSRDIGAQGFVSLLRSVGLHARLVFSLQPPDFTDNIKTEATISRSASPAAKVKPRPQKPVLKGLRPGEKLLAQFRNKTTINNESLLGSQSIDKESEFPVFWCEVWDKFNKKWISIDPITFKYIEVVRVVSKFEPPSTDERNNAYYVLGYDNDGAVRDITRRYARNYNAKIRKKRITRDPKGEEWYNRLITALCSEQGRLESGMDLKELEYFNRKSLQEGMPNSIQDFKNHPLYVLESQLRSNEFISPKTPCGRTRKKNSKTTETIPVYKRENVHIVRSAKAWYMRGRILKPGARPMLTKPNTNTKASSRYEDDLFGDDEVDDEEDTDTRLYAESQTELYVPPLVVDGEVPKNAYGNIDLYVPSMLPANASHRESRFALKAAKSLGIDYAEACVGFEFSKGGASTPKTRGIVISQEYDEVMAHAEKTLEQEEEERLRKRAEMNALRGWRLLLTKARIKDDLNKKYGNVDGVDEAAEKAFDNIEKTFAKQMRESYEDDDEDDGDLYQKYYDSTPSNVEEEEIEEDEDGGSDDFGGGFLPQDAQPDFDEPNNAEDSEVDDHMPSHTGYFDDDNDDGSEDNGEQGGGFMVDDDDTSPHATHQHEGDTAIYDTKAVQSHEDTRAIPHKTMNRATRSSSRFSISKRSSSESSEDEGGVEGGDFVYDPAVQEALLNESVPESSTTLQETVEDSQKFESDNESTNSLELANEGIEDDAENKTEEEDYYDDNEFEYSDDD